MRFLSYFILISIFTACSAKHEVTVKKYTGFPIQNENYQIGVAAPFVATLSGNAIMAGGCNFPDKPAQNKGAKIFYDDIYITNLPNNNQNSSSLNWEKIGKLPHPIAYGATAQMPDGNSAMFIGGCNDREVFDDIYRITFSHTLDSVIFDTFPPLPKPRHNMAAIVLENKLYVIGGVVDGQPTNSVISIDLDAKSVKDWSNESDFPDDPRTQLIAVEQAGEIFIFGGHAPYMGKQNASVSLTAYKFQPNNNEWMQINSPVDDDGNLVALAAGNVAKLENKYILLSGGVDKDIFLRALVREQKMSMTVGDNMKTYAKFNDLLVKEYLTQPVDWYQFNGKVLLYDVEEDSYTQIAISPYLARAGAGTLQCNDGLFVISGEIKPGVRSPDVTRVTVKLDQ